MDAEQLYMGIALFCAWPVFFVYMAFFYTYQERRPRLIGILLSTLIWAGVWPVVLAIAAYKKVRTKQ